MRISLASLARGAAVSGAAAGLLFAAAGPAAAEPRPDMPTYQCQKIPGPGGTEIDNCYVSGEPGPRIHRAG